MKYYDTKLIKNYIEKNKDVISSVDCGMKEDWGWTASTVYEDNKYSRDLNNEFVEIAGIEGSYWATPVMEVEFKDGRTEILKCFKEDSNDCTHNEKEIMKSFAFITGGMDDVESLLGGKQ